MFCFSFVNYEFLFDISEVYLQNIIDLRPSVIYQIV